MTPGWRLATGTAALVVSVVTGVGLGNYVSARDSNRATAGQESLNVALPPSVDQVALSVPVQPDLSPDAPVICKGCGPTLAERQQAAEEARYGALGYGLSSSDPEVRRYLKDAAEEEARWNRRDAVRATTDSLPVPIARTIAVGSPAQPIGAGTPN